MQLVRLGALLSATAVVAAGCGGTAEESETLGTDTRALGRWSVMELADGWSPSLAVDGKGVPTVSVTQGVPNARKQSGDNTPVVFWNDGSFRSGTGWTRSDIGYAPGYLDGAFFNSVAMNVGRPQLAFSRRVNGGKAMPITLELATRGMWGWQVDTLDSSGWIYQAVQRVSDDTTWVVYQDPTNSHGALRVATTASGSWQTYGFPMPLALLSSLDAAVTDPSAGKPVLGVATTTLDTSAAGEPRGLHFARSDDGGVTWTAPVHIDDTWGMIGPQIAFSGTDPVIAYTELDAHRAKFASSSDGGVSWKVETIGTFDVNPATGVAVDPRNGEPVVAIVADDFATGKDRLSVARRDATGNWVLETVDTVDSALGRSFVVNPRIAVLPDGTVVLAYAWVDDIAQETRVRFAWSSPPVIIHP